MRVLINFSTEKNLLSLFTRVGLVKTDFPLVGLIVFLAKSLLSCSCKAVYIMHRRKKKRRILSK